MNRFATVFTLVLIVLIASATAFGQTTYTSTASGNWSTMTWSPVGTPGPLDNVIIADGNTVTFDLALSTTITNLTVGQGTSGILMFDRTTGRSLTVTGDVTVAAGGSFLSTDFNALTPTGDLTLASTTITNVSSTAGIVIGMTIGGNNFNFAAGTTVIGFTANTITTSAAPTVAGTTVPLTIQLFPAITQTLTIGGNLINNGTFDMSKCVSTTNGSTTVCNVTFNNTGGDQTISGTTPVLTRFRGVTLTKGATSNKVVSTIDTYIGGNGFTLTMGTWDQHAGNLINDNGSKTLLANGKLLIDGTGGYTNYVGTSYQFPRYTSGSLSVTSGIFEVNTTGTVQIGVGNNSITTPTPGGTINLIAGTMIMYGRITITFGTTTISGANIFIDPQPTLIGNFTANLAASSNAFEVSGTPTFNFTSGSVTLVNPTIAAAAGRDLKITSTGTTNITNGVFYIGDGVSTKTSTGSLIYNGFVNGSTVPIANVIVQTGNIAGRNFGLKTNLPVSGTLTIKSGLVETAIATSTRLDYGATGTLAYNGSSAQTSTDVEFPVTGGPINLTINNSAGVALHASRTIPGTLTLSSGIITTGANILTLGPAGTVTRTSGHIAGNLQKNVALGSPSLTFEIGDAVDYRPINLAFSSVGTAGNVTATVSQTAGDHPSIATSGLNAAKSVNRYWTLTNSGVVFTDYGATFNFVAGDIDAGANTANFAVRRFDAPSTWSTTTPGTRTSTSTQATGITGMSDFAVGERAPIAGTKNIPGDYATITAAVADLNALGVGTGGVTFNVAAGYTETIAAAISLTATGTAGNPIIFQKSGVGANPLITAYVGVNTPGTAVHDDMWQLVGSDYVTIDGIDLTDPNATNPATMEGGYVLYKASLSDGAQNNTIKNCVITLNRINNASGSGPSVEGSRGIEVTNATPVAATTALTPTTAAGTNSNNKFYTNTIQNCNYGIVLSGFAAATPFTAGDTGNDIGGASAGTGNQILNYGGAAAAVNPAAGVLANNQWGANISYNTINNNNGAGVNHVTTLRGIYGQAGTSANVTINNNTITVQSGATTSALTAIENAIGATAAGNTVSISNNTITGCTYATATSGAFTGILNSASAANVIIKKSIVSGNATNATSGTMNLIQNSGAATVSVLIDSNSVNGMTFNAAFAGTLNCFNNSGGTAAAALSMSANDIQNITHAVAGSGSHTYVINSAATLSQNINYNTFTNLNVNTTGSATFISNSVTLPASGVQNVNGNSIVTAFNKGGAGGTVTVFTTGASSPSTATINQNNNKFSNITVTGATTLTGWSNSDGVSSPYPFKTISGNKFTNWTGGTSAITVMSLNYFGSTSAVSADTISTITGQSTIIGMTIGSTGAAAPLTVSSNVISSLSSTGTGGSVTGLSSSNASTSINFTGNQINTLSSTGASSTVLGMSSSSGTTVTISGNAINTLSATGITSPLVTGLSITGGTTVSASGNTINTLSDAGATSPVVSGLSVSGGTTVNVLKNKIYDLSQSGAITTTSPAVNGLVVSAGTTVTATNNIIGDLRTPAASLADAIRGISVTSATATTTYNVYYNTVRLAATSTGANFGTTGLFHTASATATTAALNARNNVVVNASTPSGTGLVVAYRLSSATLGNYSATSNNNDFYAGTPGASNLIFYDGTNSDQTIAAYMTRVSTRDAASFTENPTFVSTTGSDPTFLHINTGVATQLESGAAPIAGITDDFDGDTRNVSTPDVGADEFAGIVLDLTPPIISYTPLANTGSLTSRSLTVTVTDPKSGVPTTAPGWPTLYWKINAGAYTAASPTSVAPYVYSFGAGVTAGDVVSYYVVAQDNAGTPNVSAFPSAGASGFTANPPAASTPPTTPSSYTITQTALAGDYTVGLTLFNSAAGTNISFERVVTRVMRQVPEMMRVPQARSVAASTERSASTGKTARSEVPAEVQATEGVASPEAGFMPTGRMVMKEVEVVSWVPKENGKTYTGPLYVKRSENPSLIREAMAGVYATITAAVADLNLRGVSGATRFLLDDTSYPTETFPLTVNVTNESVPTAANTVTFKPNTGVTSTVSGAAASTQIFKIMSSYVTIDGSNAAAGTTRDLTLQNTSTTTPGVVLIASTGTTPITNVTLKNCTLTNGVNSSTAVIVADVAGVAGYFNNITIQNNKVQLAYIGVYNLAFATPGNGSGLLITGNDLNTAGANSIRLVGVYVQGVDGATVTNNNISNIVDANAESPKGIWFATATNSGTISGNTLSSLSLTNTGAFALTGIYVSSTTVTSLNITGNTISTLSNAGTALAYAGILTFGPNTNITNNTVSGITQTGAAAFWGIVQSGAVNSSLSGNTVSGMLTATTGTTSGINVQGASTGVIIEKNKVSNIKNTNSGGYGANGMLLSSSSVTAAITVKNNFIFDVTGYGYASGAGVADNGYGIIISLGGGYNIYYNSVNLNTNQTVAGLPSAFNVTSGVTTAASLDVRNNLFVSTQTLGTERYAIYSGAANTVFSSIDYNDYYSTGADLGFISVNRPLLSDIVTGFGGNTHSIKVSPAFVSATNLHIDPSISTPLESGGIVVASVTNDIDGDIRFGAPGYAGSGTAPDLGADEFAGTPLPSMVYVSSNTDQVTGAAVAGVANQSIIRVVVVTTGSFSPLTLTQLTLNANGTTNISDINATPARVYYTGTSTVFSTATLFGSATPTIANFNVTGSQALVEGNNYFWLAYDVGAGATVGNFIDGECTGMIVSTVAHTPTTTAPAGNKQLVGPMSGDYTVGVSLFNRATGHNLQTQIMKQLVSKVVPVETQNDTKGVKGAITMSRPPVTTYTTIQVEETYGVLMENGHVYTGPLMTDSPNGIYATITAAIGDANLRGVSGPVRFLLTDASYAESFPIVINPITGASGTNTITILPNSSVTTTISGSSASSIFKLNGASYIIFDGSNSGGSDRSMTISNTNTSSTTAAIWLASGGLGAGATHTTIKNCVIATGSNTATTYAISAGSTIGASGADNDNLTIQNNDISKAYYGVYVNGTAATSAGGDDGLIISNNIIGPAAAGANNVGFAGIWVQNALTVTISGNTVRNVVTTSGSSGAIYLSSNVNGATISLNTITNISSSASAGGTSSITGLYLGGAVINATVSRNSLQTIVSTATGGWGSRAMIVNTANATSGITIANNVIADVSSYEDASNSYWPIGIDIDGTTGGVGVYFNSVNLYGSHPGFTTTAGASAALFVSGSGGSLDIRDNIFANSFDNTSSTGDKSYAVYSSAAASVYADINYNDYYVSGPTGVLGFLTADQATLGAWQAATGKDANSKAVDPLYVAANDLRLNVGSPMVAGATPIAGITVDFTGATRSGSTPTIGAYENAINGGPAIGYTALANTYVTGNVSLNGVTITDADGVAGSSVAPRIYWKVNAGSWTSAATTSGSSPYDFTIGTTGLSIGDVVSYYVIAQDNLGAVSANPGAGLVASDVNTVTTPPTTPNTYTIIANPNYGGGGAGTGGYYFANSTSGASGAPSQPTYNWIDPVASGHTLILDADWTGGGDDGYVTPVPIGFTYTFYGTDFTQLSIGSNGWVTFNSPVGLGALTQSPIPTAGGLDNFVAGAWRDLDSRTATYGDAKVYYGAIPGGFVVTFFHTHTYSSATDYISFQIILYSGNFDIKIQYNDAESTLPTPPVSITNSCAVGIENSTGALGVQYRYNGTGGPMFGSPLAIEFGTNPAALPIQLSSFTAHVIPTGVVRIDWTTTSETNNYGFYVQRRLAGTTDWTTVSALIPGHGTTLEPHNYTYADHSVTVSGTYQYRLRQMDLDGLAHHIDPISINVGTTDVVETAPKVFALFQNYPNPFNPETVVKFSVENTGRTTLFVYNVLGQKVATLFDETAEAGQYYKVRLNGSNLASGMYIYRLQSGTQTNVKKMLLLK